MNERALNDSNDIYLDGERVARCLNLYPSVSMRVKTILQTFLGEVFYNPSYGTPWFQKILGKDELSITYARQIITEKISKVDGVKSVDIVDVSLDNRTLKINYTAKLDNGETIKEGVNING